MVLMKIIIDCSDSNRKDMNALVKNVDFVNVKACGTNSVVRYYMIGYI